MRSSGNCRRARTDGMSRARTWAAFVAVLIFLALPARSSAADPVVYAAGDIACDPADPAFNGGAGTATACRQQATADLMADGTFDTVLALGDLQYDSGSLSNFMASYDKSWGRVKPLTRPVIGNHEGTSATSAAGYCSYFGPAAHCNGSGRQGNAAFYSFDIGAWHVVVLNSNCDAAGGCAAGSPQYAWLQSDLAANPAACTLAAWHHPRWSSGHDGSNAFMQPLWQLFVGSGGDLALAGHSHDYERFAPIDATGAVNADGASSFVVGTGGAHFTGISGTPEPGSQIRQNTSFGVLRLVLHPTSYDWTFIPAAGSTFNDSGTRNCRGFTGGGDVASPSIPAGLRATADGSTRVDLRWNASTDNVGIAGYDIFRGTGNGTVVAIKSTTGTATSYSDTGLTAGTTYRYRLRARDAAGNVSALSSAVSVTTPDTKPPTAPSNLRAVAAGAKRVNLTWTASDDDVAVAGYQIWRGGSTGALSRIATHPGTATSHADTAVAGKHGYRYEVVAYDAAGNVSPSSSPAEVTTPAESVPPVVVVKPPVVVTPPVVAVPTVSNLLARWSLSARAARRSLARGSVFVRARRSAPAVVRVRVGGRLAAKRQVEFRRAFRIRLARWAIRRAQRGRAVTVTVRVPRSAAP
jgi:chitodextrinase